jgi:hypothetical protein
VPLSIEVLFSPLHTVALGSDLVLVKVLQCTTVVEDEEDLMEAVGSGNRNGPPPHDRPSLGAPVYFCDSRSPWQRGSNENTNGLLRDYFPRGTDLSTHSSRHLLAVENELNKRPRIVLNDRTPAELFWALLASKNRPRCDVD